MKTEPVTLTPRGNGGESSISCHAAGEALSLFIMSGEMIKSFTYVGSELDLFSRATNWKAYWGDLISPHLRGEILEVGSGIGANTAQLRSAEQRSWSSLEPDPTLCERAQTGLSKFPFPVTHLVGVLDSLDPALTFDCLLYLDVLEHIEDDAKELQSAAARLRPNGKLIILSPAHAYLYSEFDSAIGHFRRYNRRTLKAVIPDAFKTERLIYLDSVGLFASLANRLFLHRSLPSKANIHTWDKLLVPVSRILDPLIGYAMGKSILGIFTK